MPVRRFWFRFGPGEAPLGMSAGCGVTAFDRDDALGLIEERLKGVPPEPTLVIQDVDVSDLDEGHVLPNMLSPADRGIWFPMPVSYR
jgi:hypothetical protein